MKIPDDFDLQQKQSLSETAIVNTVFPSLRNGYCYCYSFIIAIICYFNLLYRLNHHPFAVGRKCKVFESLFSGGCFVNYPTLIINTVHAQIFVE